MMISHFTSDAMVLIITCPSLLPPYPCPSDELTGLRPHLDAQPRARLDGRRRGAGPEPEALWPPPLEPVERRTEHEAPVLVPPVADTVTESQRRIDRGDAVDPTRPAGRKSADRARHLKHRSVDPRAELGLQDAQRRWRDEPDRGQSMIDVSRRHMSVEAHVSPRHMSAHVSGPHAAAARLAPPRNRPEFELFLRSRLTASGPTDPRQFRLTASVPTTPLQPASPES